MKRHIETLALIALLGMAGSSRASEFREDFESYVAGSAMHGQGGWKGWDNVAAVDALVSNVYASGGRNSVEVLAITDLVHEFSLAGGRWVLTAMQYVPSGAAGTTFFILLNTYRDGGPNDWSVQTEFDLGAGTVLFWHGGTAQIRYDQWVELKYVIDLDNNMVDKYYNGEFIVTDQWDDNEHGTLGAIDLYGNGASSVYYDNIKIESLSGSHAYGAADGAPANAVYVDAEGKVGIGTASPDEELTIDGTLKATGSQRGVWGIATHTGEGWNEGGRFEASGVGGWGVFGRASGLRGCGVRGFAAHTDSSAENYGGYFRTMGGSGRGVYGIASDTGDGENYGGYFLANGGKARAVYGFASNSEPSKTVRYGGYFVAKGRRGYGVYGEASSPDTASFTYGSYGGYFLATGYMGRGVYGLARGDGGCGVVASGKQYDFLANGAGRDYGSLSSIRWKGNIQAIDDPLDKVNQLRGVYFDWDADHGGQHDVGMIAEEVGEVLPEIVVYEEDGQYATGMDYSKLTPLLVEAVKELKAEVDNLREEVTRKNTQIVEQNQQIVDLTARLDCIDSMVSGLSAQRKQGL